MQNGELYNHATCATSSPRRPPVPKPLRHRDPPAPLRASTATAFAERLRGKFGLAVWDGARPARRARPRPARGQAALLRRASATSSCSPPSSRACSPAASSRDELDYEAIDAYLTLGFVPAPHTPLAGVPQARCPGHRLVVDGRQRPRSSAYWRYPQPDPAARRATRGHREQLLDAARGVGAAATDERRPARRDAVRRPRLEPHRRAHGRAT